MIKAVNRENWITASNMSVPLKLTTAVVAEVAAAYNLTEMLDLMLRQKMNVDTVAHCIDIFNRWNLNT